MPSDRRPAPISVCVVTHDDEAEIAPFIHAVDRLDPAPAELIVVDCASIDGTPQALRRHTAARLPTAVETLDENLGYAGGMNRALSLATAPWLLTLNADCRPDPDFLARLLERGASDDRIAAVTGKLRRRTAGRLDACGMYLTPAWRHHDRGSGQRERGRYDRPCRVFGATGAAVLLRRRALDDVAVDDEAFASEFHSFREDAELAFRLRERGWEIAYEPTARAEHRRSNLPSRRRSMPTEVNFHSLKNRYLLRAYHQSPVNVALTLIPTVARDLAALVYVLVSERSSLAAYRWLWRHRRSILRKRRILRARRTVRASAIERWFWRRARPLP